MDDILDYLEELTHPSDWPPAYFELIKALGPLTDKVVEALSLEFLDQLDYAQSEVLNFHCQEAFSRGFRLGAQIILALAEPSAPDTHHRSSSRR